MQTENVAFMSYKVMMKMRLNSSDFFFSVVLLSIAISGLIRQICEGVHAISQLAVRMPLLALRLRRA